MATDRQVRRFEKTARKYPRLGQLPSKVRVEHTWRTRGDLMVNVL